MIGESLIITALLAMIAVMMLKSKRKKWALATLPIMLLPMVNAVAKPVCIYVLKQEFTFIVAVWTILISLMVSCIWIGFLSATLLNRKKVRLVYLFVSAAFNILLAAAFMWDHYHSLGGSISFF